LKLKFRLCQPFQRNPRAFWKFAVMLVPFTVTGGPVEPDVCILWRGK